MWILIHMEYQATFSLKKKMKNEKQLLQIAIYTSLNDVLTLAMLNKLRCHAHF